MDIEIHAYGNAYMGYKLDGNCAYIVWRIPHENYNSFELFRDGERIAYSSNREETHEFFEHPHPFDHDHCTNLFRKDSPYKLWFKDEGVQRFQTYTYHVVARDIAEDGRIMAISHSPQCVMHID